MDSRPSPQPTGDEIARPWTREHHRDVWHFASAHGAMLCGVAIAGSPLVMSAADARTLPKCCACWTASR